ncbi:hypothetical protein Cus16_0649 [Curtobacterium sp. ER1/6]|nr:hypothetical protein Cus16_0649 [Curtobacterium sp. ER1/6]
MPLERAVGEPLAVRLVDDRHHAHGCVHGLPEGVHLEGRGRAGGDERGAVRGEPLDPGRADRGGCDRHAVLVEGHRVVPDLVVVGLVADDDADAAALLDLPGQCLRHRGLEALVTVPDARTGLRRGEALRRVGHEVRRLGGTDGAVGQGGPVRAAGTHGAIVPAQPWRPSRRCGTRTTSAGRDRDVPPLRLEPLLADADRAAGQRAAPEVRLPLHRCPAGRGRGGRRDRAAHGLDGEVPPLLGLHGAPERHEGPGEPRVRVLPDDHARGADADVVGAEGVRAGGRVVHADVEPRVGPTGGLPHQPHVAGQGHVAPHPVEDLLVAVLTGVRDAADPLLGLVDRPGAAVDPRGCPVLEAAGRQGGVVRVRRLRGRQGAGGHGDEAEAGRARVAAQADRALRQAVGRRLRRVDLRPVVRADGRRPRGDAAPGRLDDDVVVLPGAEGPRDGRPRQRGGRAVVRPADRQRVVRQRQADRVAGEGVRARRGLRDADQEPGVRAGVHLHVGLHGVVGPSGVAGHGLRPVGRAGRLGEGAVPVHGLRRPRAVVRPPRPLTAGERVAERQVRPGVVRRRARGAPVRQRRGVRSLRRAGRRGDAGHQGQHGDGEHAEQARGPEGHGPEAHEAPAGSTSSSRVPAGRPPRCRGRASRTPTTSGTAQSTTRATHPAGVRSSRAAIATAPSVPGGRGTCPTAPLTSRSDAPAGPTARIGSSPVDTTSATGRAPASTPVTTSATKGRKTATTTARTTLTPTSRAAVRPAQPGRNPVRSQTTPTPPTAQGSIRSTHPAPGSTATTRPTTSTRVMVQASAAPFASPLVVIAPSATAVMRCV